MMLKNKISVFIVVGLAFISSAAFAAENPAASVATIDLAHRLYIPESKIMVIGVEGRADGAAVVSLQAAQGKSGRPTHRYTLRPASANGQPAFQIVRVDRANGTHDEYEYDGAGHLAAVKQFGRQNKQIHTITYARDARTGFDRVTQILHNDWTKPQQGFVDSFDIYHYSATGVLEKVERFPNEANTRPENLFATFSYGGAPGLERIVKSVDRRGMPVEYVYSKDGALVRTLAGNQTVTDYTPDEFGDDAVQKTTDYRGMETAFTYDAKGVLAKTVAADGVVTEFVSISDTVLPSKKTEPNGRATVYTYDASGAPTKITILNGKNEVVDETTYTRGAGETAVATTAVAASDGSGGGLLRSAASSDGFKYTYTQTRYKDVIATATDPKGRTKMYTYDDSVRPARIVYREAQYADEYDYSGQTGVLVSPSSVKRYSSQGGALIGTFKYDADRPSRFDFADGLFLTYEKGQAKELRSAKNELILTFKNQIVSQNQLAGFKVYDASGKELGSYAAYEDPVEIAAIYLKGTTA